MARNNLNLFWSLVTVLLSETRSANVNLNFSKVTRFVRKLDLAFEIIRDLTKVQIQALNVLR